MINAVKQLSRRRRILESFVVFLREATLQWREKFRSPVPLEVLFATKPNLMNDWPTTRYIQTSIPPYSLSFCYFYYIKLSASLNTQTHSQYTCSISPLQTRINRLSGFAIDVLTNQLALFNGMYTMQSGYCCSKRSSRNAGLMVGLYKARCTMQASWGLIKSRAWIWSPIQPCY